MSASRVIRSGGRRGGWDSKVKPSKEKETQMERPWRALTPLPVQGQEETPPSNSLDNSSIGEDAVVIGHENASEADTQSPPQSIISQREAREVEEEEIATGAFRHATTADATPPGATPFTTAQVAIVVPRDMRKTKHHAVLWTEQTSGVIVGRFDCRLALDPNSKIGDPDVILGPDERLWIYKWRFFIILRQFAETVAEVPIYTCGDKGLATKPPEVRCEYLSVKPLGIAVEDFINQSPGNPILSVDEIVSSRYDFDRMTMVAHFTESLPRSLDCDELAVVGKLTTESTKTLLEYAYQRAIDGGL